MWKRLCILGFFISGLLNSSLLLGVGVDREVVWKLSIAVPESNGVYAIHLSPEEHFHVVLENRSKGAQRIWKESNSWGYAALYFEIVDDFGRKQIIRKPEKNWRKNAPGYWTITAGKHLIYNRSLSSNEWGLNSHHSSEARRLKIQAVLEIHTDFETRELGVWTGMIKSNVYEIDIVN